MKRIFAHSITTIILLIFATSIVAQEETKVKWYTIEEAVKLNKKKKKKIFIDLYTDWCGWCKKMDANTFSDPIIAAYLNENYYPVKFDAESSEPVTVNGQEYVNPNPGARRSSHQFAIALLSGKMSYPSFAFLDQDVKLITVLPGYNPPEKLEPILHFIVDEAYKDESFQEYQATFKSSFH
jgi:thioredoxin-related protein